MALVAVVVIYPKETRNTIFQDDTYVAVGKPYCWLYPNVCK